MRAEYKSGQISINFTEVLCNMSADEKRELIESLSCDEAVVTFVGQQIIDKWTESGFYSGVSFVATAEAYGGLDKVWRDVAKASGEVAKREIERLEDALRFERKQTESAWAAYHAATERRYS